MTETDLLQKHGFRVSENAEMGFPPTPVHVSGSWHYRCNDSGALDVNHDQGDEKGAIDGLVAHLHDLGFRTIWQAEGHFDHIHIDVANSPSIGAGFGSERSMWQRQIHVVSPICPPRRSRRKLSMAAGCGSWATTKS